jgi:hypothetical protein
VKLCPFSTEDLYMWRCTCSRTTTRAVRGRVCDYTYVQPSFYIHRNQYNHHSVTESTRRNTCLLPCILTSELDEGQWSTSGFDRLTPQGRSQDTNYIEDFLCPRACAVAPLPDITAILSVESEMSHCYKRTDWLMETSRLWFHYMKFLKVTTKKTLLRLRCVCISRIDVTLFRHTIPDLTLTWQAIYV